MRCSLKLKDVSHGWAPVAPPGFCNMGEVRYGSIGGLEYEVPQSRLYCPCINVALCSTALQCICRVIRRSSMTMKAHTYYIIFGRPPMGGGTSPPPSPLAAPLLGAHLSECGAERRRPRWLPGRSTPARTAPTSPKTSPTSSPVVAGTGSGSEQQQQQQQQQELRGTQLGGE